MNDTTAKTEEPEDGVLTAQVTTSDLENKQETKNDAASFPAEVVTESPQVDPLLEEETAAESCDQIVTKDETLNSESDKDVDTEQNQDLILPEAVVIEIAEETPTSNGEKKVESPPLEPMDTSSTEPSENATLDVASNKILAENIPSNDEKEKPDVIDEKTVIENVEEPKESLITIPNLDSSDNMDSVDSPESQLVIEESILLREKSISPPIVLQSEPDSSPPRILSPPIIQSPTLENPVVQTMVPEKPPSPAKPIIKDNKTKELVIPKEQLDILKKHLNQEQFLSLKQLAEERSLAKIHETKELSTNATTVREVIDPVPIKPEKQQSSVLERQLSLQRLPVKIETATQKLPSPEIFTKKSPISEIIPSFPETSQKPKIDTQKLLINETKKIELIQKPVKPEISVQNPKETTPKIQEKLPSPSEDVAAILKSVDKELDVDMVDSEVKGDREKKKSPGVQAVNGDVTKEDPPVKRRASEDLETESPLKKLCQEVEKTFPHHDTMIVDYIQSATKNNIDEIQKHTEQLLAEIQTLRELAQKKEHEWNNILHMKKVKEEILLRLLRKKQVISFEKAPEVNGSGKDPFDYLNQGKSLAIDKSDEISGLALKQPTPPINPPMNMNMHVSINSSMPSPMNSMNTPINSMNHMMQPPVMPVSNFNPLAGLPPPYDKVAHMNMQKQYPQPIMMAGPTMPGFPRDMNGQMAASYLPMGRQGPTKDVKSIIADYRQRNPDVSPRRGRRMKTVMNPNMMNNPRQIVPKMENLGMLFNNLDMNQKAMLERLTQMQAANLSNGMSFKDVLVQFASMQQPPTNMMPTRPDMMPNRPECLPNRPELNPSRPEQNPSRPEHRPRRPERHQEEQKERERAAASPRLPPPPPYPEISLLPVSTNQDGQQNSLLHGILTKQASPAQSRSPTLAKLLTSPERKQAALPTFGQAKNCGEITITPVQPPPPEPPAEKQEEVVQLDDEESPASEGSASEAERAEGAEGTEGAEGAEGAEEAPLCQGCRKRDAQFVCAGCANQWYCSRDCQVAAWDEHSEMCSG